MIHKTFIGVLIFLSTTSAHAQAVINQEKIEQLREAAREANADPMAAQSRMQSEWMNGDWLTTQNRNWNSSVPVRQTVGGLQVSIEPETRRTAPTKSPQSSNARSRTIDNSIAKSRENAQRYQEMLEERRARAEEEKRRKREEDDRSEMEARIMHYNMTEGFYQRAAARDHWHATEGARLLSEIKAEDFVKKPQRQESNGPELAKMIRPKSEMTGTQRVPIVLDEGMLKDQPFDAGNNHVAISGNTDMSEEQVGTWSNAYQETDLVRFQPPKMKEKGKSSANKKEPTILVSNEELPLEALSIFVLPQYDLVAAWRDSLYVLKDENLGTLTWNDGGHYTHVVTCGNRLIGKKDNALFVIDDSVSEKLLEFDTNEFSLFAHDEESVLLLCWSKGLSTILQVNVAAQTYSELARVPFNIWSLASNGNIIYALVEHSIFAINSTGQLRKIYTSEDEVNDIAITSSGLLIATNQYILQLESILNVSLFYNKGAKRLWFDGENVYALNEESNLVFF